MRVELKLELVNSSSTHNTAMLPITFKTKDSNGKHVFYNRGRAVNQILKFLFDSGLARPVDVIFMSAIYDRVEKKEYGFSEEAKKVIEAFGVE